VAVAEAASRARGSLAVIANESVGTYILPPALVRLRAKWPGMQVSVSIGTCADVREGVAQGRYDVGVLLGADPAPTRRRSGTPAETPLALVRLELFCAARHPLAAGRPQRLLPRDGLGPCSVLVPDASGDFHAMLSQYFDADGVPGPRLEPRGTIESVKRGVIGSVDILGVLPRYALEEELRAGLVRVVELRPPLPQVRVESVLRNGGPAHPAVTDLVELLRRRG
jgi:DNA-binding transcriptional LysR family regulator